MQTGCMIGDYERTSIFSIILESMQYFLSLCTAPGEEEDLHSSSSYYVWVLIRGSIMYTFFYLNPTLLRTPF